MAKVIFVKITHLNRKNKSSEYFIFDFKIENKILACYSIKKNKNSNSNNFLFETRQAIKIKNIAEICKSCKYFVICEKFYKHSKNFNKKIFSEIFNKYSIECDYRKNFDFKDIEFEFSKKVEVSKVFNLTKEEMKKLDFDWVKQQIKINNI